MQAGPLWVMTWQWSVSWRSAGSLSNRVPDCIPFDWLGVFHDGLGKRAILPLTDEDGHNDRALGDGHETW